MVSNPSSAPVESADEATPLLRDEGQSTDQNGSQETRNPDQAIENHNAEDVDRPLPKLQIFLLCYARIVEPIAFFGIFPFINKMIWETGNIDKTDVGFYSGLIESLFSLTQMMLMIFWGRLSDRLGRKPVLVFSLISVSIATAMFGLSRKIWHMILFRCLAGVFAGTVVTIRTMIAENSTQKTQARAFSFFVFTNNLGILIGPLIGGALANPADQFPSVFGNIRLFKDYPYALPSFIFGGIGATAVVTSTLFIKETLKGKFGGKKSSETHQWSTSTIYKSPGVSFVIFIYGYIMLLAFAYTAVSPVFWFTDIAHGGFSFTPPQMSLFYFIIGISQATWALLIFPPLQRRFGTVRILKVCAYCWPFLFAICPVCNLLLRHNYSTAFWILAPVAQTLGSGVSMSFIAVQLALNDVCPSPAALGTLNGLALTVSSAIRAFAPALFSSLFAQSAGSAALGGYTIWVIMISMASGLSFRIISMTEPPRTKQAVSTNDERLRSQNGE